MTHFRAHSVLALVLAAASWSAGVRAQSPAASLPLVSNVLLADEELMNIIPNSLFTIRVFLTWDADPLTVPAGKSLFYRVTDAGGELITSGSETPLTAGDGLISAFTINGVTTGSTGWVGFALQLSWDEEFAKATEPHQFTFWCVPGAVTLLPPLLTIILAVATGEVLISLFVGMWSAAFVFNQYNPASAFLRVLDTIIVDSFADGGHVMIILFSWYLSGMVSVLYKSGGGHGLARQIANGAKDRRSTQLVVFAMSLCIFFDDYANTLLTGMTMRPVTDNMSISREKLAYIVDSAAACLASLMPISSWIGFELSQIEDGFASLAMGGADLSGYTTNPYLMFLATIASRYYPIFVVTMQLALITYNREAGPMLYAERRAKFEGKLMADDANADETGLDHRQEPEADTPLRWWNAAIPIVATVVFVMLGVVMTGVVGAQADGLPLTAANIFSYCDSYLALTWGTFGGSMVVWAVVLLQHKKDNRIYAPYWLRWLKCLPTAKGSKPLMSLDECLQYWISGFKSLQVAILTLIFAWGIGLAMKMCGTGNFIAEGLKDSLPAGALPVLVFVLSAVIAFSTGTSWGTMSIMFPIAMPTAYAVAPGNNDVMVLTISAILAGAVYGDHCTYISDTTILSAMSSKCDLRHHVRTQFPYATAVMIVSALLGYLPAGFGTISGAFPYWAVLLVGLAVVCGLSWVLTTPVYGKVLDPLSTLFRLKPPPSGPPSVARPAGGEGGTGDSSKDVMLEVPLTTGYGNGASLDGPTDVPGGVGTAV